MTQDRGFGRGQHPEELLSAAVSGDLTGAERAAVDAHLLGCDRCRATLQAFSEERRLIGGMRHVAPPRDLGARVRAGIEGRRAPADPWWRRPGTLVAAFASLTTIAAALLAVVVFSDVQRGPTGATGEASASASASATQTASLTPPPTTNPSVEDTPTPKPSAPTTALETGQVGYLQVDGQPQRELRLSFVNDATGTLTRLGPTGGPPVVAALSPTNEFL
ncbi:MAG TPA: zf-HC2 domain-containing protein, partial [Candidatus Limnocylindria bacterium]|nr:zf-HC2 domain-containing protein [Candidatus Limnocylindria bacterium]